MTAAFLSVRSIKFVPALTGIRAIAALFVLALHVQQNLLAEVGTYLPFVLRGYLGVDFFFLLSGFIITHVYLRGLARPGARPVLIFLWHRFIRLYPVHAFVLAVLVLANYLALSHGAVANNPYAWRWDDLPWHFALMHSWGFVSAAGWNPPSWSISAEWFAYLLFPLLAIGIWAIRDRLFALSLAGICVAATAAVFRLNQWDLGWSWVGAPALVRVTGEFACGAFIRRSLDSNASFALPRWVADASGLAAIVLFLVGASVGVADFVLVALFAVTILAAATAQGALSRLLSNRPMVWLGEVSYSVYMVHFPMLVAMHRALNAAGFERWNGLARTLGVTAALSVTIGVAAVVFYTIESPARARLRDSLGLLASQEKQA